MVKYNKLLGKVTTKMRMCRTCNTIFRTVFTTAKKCPGCMSPKHRRAGLTRQKNDITKLVSKHTHPSILAVTHEDSFLEKKISKTLIEVKHKILQSEARG